MRTLPSIILKICYNCDAWIVGGAAKPKIKPEEIRDYDIAVPFINWHNCLAIIPDTKEFNSFNCIKFLDKESGKYVDVWPSDLSWLFQRKELKYAYHPLSNTRIIKYEEIQN